MMVAGPDDSANRSEGQGSQPGAAGGWRDAYRVLSSSTSAPSHLRAIYNTWPKRADRLFGGLPLALKQQCIK